MTYNSTISMTTVAQERERAIENNYVTRINT